MSVGLGRSQLDSKGGVVGGTIDVNAVEMVGMLKFIAEKYDWIKIDCVENNKLLDIETIHEKIYSSIKKYI